MKIMRMLPTIALLGACSNPSPSDLDYAHAPGSQATLSPLGGIHLLKSEVRFDHDVYSVCIRKNNGFITDEQLLLETKLAYATWLSSAGITEDDWSLFAFELKDQCPDNQSSLAAVVILNKERDSGSQELQAFPESRVMCSRSGFSYSCGTQSGTVGRGRWGGASYSYNPRSGKWISINGFSQIRATFSQHVNWYSLVEDIDQNESLSDDRKEFLLEQYDKLLKENTFEDLVAFQNEITEDELVSSGDRSFSKIFKDFQKSNESQLNRSYRANLGLYHVLLHEVGHNFGMQHSHEIPDDGYTSVETPGLKIEEDGQVKYVSTMAYSDSYLYLTLDDVLGIQSMKKETDDYFSDKL